jgi:hypothetical protein
MGVSQYTGHNGEETSSVAPKGTPGVEARVGLLILFVCRNHKQHMRNAANKFKPVKYIVLSRPFLLEIIRFLGKKFNLQGFPSQRFLDNFILYYSRVFLK